MTTRYRSWLFASAVVLACGDADQEREVDDTTPARDGGAEQALASDAQTNNDAASATERASSNAPDASGHAGAPDGSVPEPTPAYKLDCGSAGIALESAGPPKNRVNYVATAGKWSKWLDYTHTPGTGKQGIFEGAQYCDKGAFRPTQDSVMNSLWRSSYFNAVSREQGVRGLYAMVRPIDDSTPLTTSAPGVLTVTVVDPAVIQVEWFVDGAQVSAAKGARFDVAARKLSAGPHTVRARAFDNTDWVRGDRMALEQTLTWNIQVP